MSGPHLDPRSGWRRWPPGQALGFGLGLAVALATALCGEALAGAPRIHPPAPSSPPSTPTSSMAPEVRLGTRHFSLQLPAGAALRPGTGADSQVGVINAGAFHFEFDYGAYSDPLLMQQGDRNYRNKTVDIGGKVAQIVSFHAAQRFPQHPYVIGVHFPTLQPSLLGMLKLTIICTLDSEAQYAAVERLYRTIQFPAGN